MFNLPAEICRLIYEFDSFKWDNLKKINNQFLKGGFNKNYDLSNYLDYQKIYAALTTKWSHSRKNIVTKYLRNIESFEIEHPKLTNY